MSTQSEIFDEKNLLGRSFYLIPGSTVITAPAGAGIIRISGNGAGAWKTSQGGGGAAFARRKTTCTPGEAFTVQVGDIAYTDGDTGTALGDSIVTRNTGSVVLMKAVRAIAAAGGLSASCVGDVTRSGSNGNTSGLFTGASAGDSSDPFPLGFGGRGAAYLLGPGPGGGGYRQGIIYNNGGGYVVRADAPPGGGKVCVEFFATDPGY